MSASKLHLNPDTGKVGRCKAEIQACRFTDPNDPNGGHYETVEEMDAYRERRAELEASGLQEGITGLSTDNSSIGVNTTGDVASGAVPAGITFAGVTAGVSGEVPVSVSNLSGTVPLPKNSRLVLPGGLENMTTEEKVRGFWDSKSFILKRPDGSTYKEGFIHTGTDFLQERKDYLNSAFGYDKNTGETFADSIFRRYKNHPSITSKIEALGRTGVVHSDKDSNFDSYQKDEIALHSLSLMDEGATIDFSNPDSLIEVETSESFYELDEANENIKLGIAAEAAKEFNYSEEVGGLKDTGKEYPDLNQKFAYDLNKALLDERDVESEETYHFYKEYLRGYAKKNGLEGKAPDDSIKSVFRSGYRMPESDIRAVIKESERLFQAQKTYKYHTNNPLGDSVIASSGSISIGNMTIPGVFHRQDQSVTGGTSVTLGYSGKGGDFDLGVELDFNPKTGEGDFRSVFGVRGTIVTDIPPFKLTKSLTEDYSETDLRNFIMSERVRYNIFQGKPWSKITFRDAEK